MKQLIITAIVTLAANMALAVPGPHIYAGAELNVMTDVNGPPIVIGNLVSVQKLIGGGAGGDSIYLVRSKLDKEYCVIVFMNSKMAPSGSGAHSTGEVVATITSSTKPALCN